MALTMPLLLGFGQFFTFLAFFIVICRFRRALGESKAAMAVMEKRLGQQELIAAITRSFILSEDSGTLIHNALMMLGMSLLANPLNLMRLSGCYGSICFLKLLFSVPPSENSFRRSLV
jgi:tellurite resistance protein TehA-like permease